MSNILGAYAHEPSVRPRRLLWISRGICEHNPHNGDKISYLWTIRGEVIRRSLIEITEEAMKMPRH